MKKGQAVLIMILIVTVLLTVVVGFLNMVTREIKIQRNLSDSIEAYYNAESKIEQAVWEIKNGSNNRPPDCTDFNFADSPGNAIITCTGQTNNSRRAIRAEIPTSPGLNNVYRPVLREVSP